MAPAPTTVSLQPDDDDVSAEDLLGADAWPQAPTQPSEEQGVDLGAYQPDAQDLVLQHLNNNENEESYLNLNDNTTDALYFDVSDVESEASDPHLSDNENEEPDSDQGGPPQVVPAA